MDNELVANFWDYSCITVAAEFLSLKKLCVLNYNFFVVLLHLSGL